MPQTQEHREVEDVFDVSKGGNLVEEQVWDDKTAKTTRSEYELVEGVWLIRSQVLNQEWPPAKGRVCRIQWKSLVVNKPLDASEFSMATLGVRPGDPVYDMVTQTRREYADETAPVGK